MEGELRERGGLQPKELGHLVQSPGKGLEKPAGGALPGAHWSVWLLLYEAAWVRGERGSGWACGWGPLRGTREGLISGGLTGVEIRPGRLRKDTTQVWDASNRLWHPGPEALVQRGRSSRLTLHPRKAVPVTGPDGGVWAEEVRQGGRQTDRKPVSPMHRDRPQRVGPPSRPGLLPVPLALPNALKVSEQLCAQVAGPPLSPLPKAS